MNIAMTSAAPKNARRSTAIDFQQYELEELLELQDKLSAALEEKRKNAIGDALDSIRATAEKLDMTPEELMTLVTGGNKKRTRTPKNGRSLPPKYRNPDEPHVVWSGRGKRPRWFTEHLESERYNEEQMRSP